MLSKYPNLVTITWLTPSQAEEYKSEDIKVTARLDFVALQAQNSPKEVKNLQTNQTKIYWFLLSYHIGFLWMFDSVFPQF